MVALLFVPLVLGLFCVGAILGLAWFLASPKDRRPKIIAVLAVPFGFAMVPIIGLAGLVVLASGGAVFQKSDPQLYEEIFGYKPTLSEDRMLFDDFGSGRSRDIFMRAEPTADERRKLLTLAGAVQSDYTLAQFISRGTDHGFTWWMSANSTDYGYCKSAKIFDVRDYRGWKELRVAECLDAGTEFPASENVKNVYVIASRRTQ